MRTVPNGVQQGWPGGVGEVHLCPGRHTLFSIASDLTPHEHRDGTYLPLFTSLPHTHTRTHYFPLLHQELEAQVVRQIWVVGPSAID